MTRILFAGDMVSHVDHAYMEILGDLGYNVKHITDRNSYDLEVDQSKYSALFMTDLTNKKLFSQQDKFEVINNAIFREIQVVALSSGNKKIDEEASEKGVVVLDGSGILEQDKNINRKKLESKVQEMVAVIGEP